MDKVNEILSNKELANRTKTSLTTVFKTGISTIPVVGSALNYLIFEHASEVRLQNMENCIKHISEQITLMQEESLDQSWFESTDALDLFKRLGLLIETEPDEEKIKVLSETYAKFGMMDNSASVYKKVVLDKIAQVSNVQRILLFVIGSKEIKREIFSEDRLRTFPEKVFYGAGVQQIRDGIVEYFHANNLDPIKNIVLGLELQILKDYNLIQYPEGNTTESKYYQLTEIGKQVFHVIKDNKKG